MRPELRFLLALTLMIGVFVVTNMIFPAVPPRAGSRRGDRRPGCLGAGPYSAW